ncbi:Ubiquitin carboxyl-terminal hydrolase 12 [Bienertia sinuspersici]
MEENPSLSNRSKPILDDATGVVQVVREQPPQHCILKIDSFSVLQDAVSQSCEDHINSTEFEAAGYNWMLTVFPNGNEKENGGGHLSLCITLIDKLISGTSINASLRFFIYDQIRDNYLTFLDVGDKGFNPLKTVWGIPKVLPLEYFTDASNGFLVNDCCSFGAEILIRNGLIKRSSVSLLGTKCERLGNSKTSPTYLVVCILLSSLLVNGRGNCSCIQEGILSRKENTCRPVVVSMARQC